MSETKEVDLLVIGTGPAASRAASKLASSGWRVAIAENREFGGTCALRGCNPKKVFVHAAQLTHSARRSHGQLVRSNGVHIDWADLIQFKREFTDSIPQNSKAGYEKKGILTLPGMARFRSPNEVLVDDTLVKPRQILIATGARPAELGFAGHEHLVTSDEFMELEQCPEEILFVGGGYISFEFAHVAAMAGSNVTVVEHGSRPLKHFSAGLVDRLIRHSRDLGIDVHVATQIRSVRKDENGKFEIKAEQEGQPKSFSAALVVHGAGRVPHLDGMELELGNVEYRDSGIQVNHFLQSVSNSLVYAAGDCADTGKPPLTPVANQEGRTIAQNLLQNEQRSPDYGPIPSAVFTIPALASVGLTEEAAMREGRKFDVQRGDMSDWTSVKKVGQSCAAYEILIEHESNQILGAHLLGPQAEETVNLFALAMKFNLTATDIKSVLITFPTFAADVRDML